MVSIDPAGAHGCPSRDTRALASDWLSLLLALEVALTGRAAADRDGPPRVDPTDECREPALGSAAHPRRAAQARISGRAIDRCQIHGQEWARAIANLEDFPLQPRTRHLRHGHVRRADRGLQTSLWLRDHAAGPATPGVDQRHHKPDRRMDRPTDHRGFPLGSGPRYLLRDRDRSYGAIVHRRLRAMGIRDHPTAPLSPWQNGHVERLIGSIRRECLDHVLVLSEAHLHGILRAYADYYNRTRTHLALGKDAPLGRTVQVAGSLKAIPLLGGLHHEYVRMA